MENETLNKKYQSSQLPFMPTYNKLDEFRRLEKKNAIIECGWGRLLFAQTFRDEHELVDELMQEQDDQRDIAFYLQDPHVILSLAPIDLFLDPSHTYRMWLPDYEEGQKEPVGFRVRKIEKQEDTQAINSILKKNHMYPAEVDFVWKNRNSTELTYIVAEDLSTGDILGTVMGVDHVATFGDPHNGSSLWCLAVEPQAAYPGIGSCLLDYLTAYYKDLGRSYLDLSVMHDNAEAIALYEDIGFKRVPVFSIKRKNSINEQLFTTHTLEDRLNPYAAIIVKEAIKRGIYTQIVDAEEGFFNLSFGGSSYACRESLSDMTTAVAMSKCANKKLTCRLLKAAGLQIPDQTLASDTESNIVFLKKYRNIVVKPKDSEQGKGVFVNLSTPEEIEQAISKARQFDTDVLLEEFIEGSDLRVVVIDYKIAAAAIRKPASVKGNGQDNILTLIEKQSRRRQAATEGESSIPIDEQTIECVMKQGYQVNDVLPVGKKIFVRSTANLHTGGTIDDVTGTLHPDIMAAAIEAARVLDIPVVGIDMIIKGTDKSDYKIIEANERPGLANHEPQPTAERFIDLLFPQTRASKYG